MKRTLTIASLLSLSLGSSLFAIDFNWTGATSTDWNDGTNWNQAGVAPSGGGGNFAFVNNGGTAVISTDIGDIQDIFVGTDGNTGILDQTAGNTFQGTNGWMFVGIRNGTGTYNLSGGVQGKERLYVGDTGGNGTLNISGTGAFNGAELNIGVGDDAGTLSVGQANLSGTGSVTTSGLVQLSNGTMSITDDAFIDGAGEFWVGQGAGRNATLDMDSGVVEADTWIAIGRDNSTGVANLSGDAVLRKVSVDGNVNSNRSFITLGGLGAGGGGTVNISGNALLESQTNLVLAESAGRAGIVNQTGGTVIVKDNTANVDGVNDSLEVDFAGGGLGEYHLLGGTLSAETIDATTGTFTMSGGTLVALAFNGNLTQNGGTLAPGASPGTMTVGGDYSFLAGDMEMELDGLTAGTEHDQLIVTGTVSLAGNLVLVVGFSPSLGDEFTLIDNQGGSAVTGTFAQGTAISAGGVDFGINYAGGDGNDVVLTVIPEPSALLLGLSGLALALRRRRN